jgi:hypothetical protein
MPSPRSVTLCIQGTFIPPLAPLFTCAATPFQIWQRHVAELVSPPQDMLELVHAWLVHHGIRSSPHDTRRRLGDSLQRARVPGQPTPWCVVPALPECQDKQYNNLHGRLTRSPAHTDPRCADNVLRLRTGDAADTTQALLRASTAGGVVTARAGRLGVIPS